MKNYSLEDFRYGQYLIEQKDEVLYEYLTKEKKKILNIRKKLSKKCTLNASNRLQEIDQDLKFIDTAMKRIENAAISL